MQVHISSLADRKWSWYLVPMNASSSGLATILPLQILALGGSVREVAIALFLSNLAMTLGAVFWGKLIDHMQWKKMIIAISSVAIFVTAVSMSLVSSMPLLMLLSALIGFFSVGPAPVTNLLVMKKSKKEEWIKTFSWTSFISCVGLVIAMVAGYVWLKYYDTQSYALICSAIAISSLALTMLFVKDPPEGRRQPNHVPIATRLKQMSALKLDFAVVMSKREFLFFAGVALFFISGNLVFTPYTPFLKENNISDSEVFLAYTVLHLSKVIFLPFNYNIVRRLGEQKMGRWSYLPRMSGIALVLGAALFMMGNAESVLLITLVAFVAIEVAYSLWSTTTTSSLLRIIPEGKEGSVLGVNSSAVGVGLLIGSVLAGEISVMFGYATTFSLAVVFLLASFAMVSRFFKKQGIAITQKATIPSQSLSG